MNDAPPPDGSTHGPAAPPPDDPGVAFAAAFEGDDWRKRLVQKRARDGEPLNPPIYLSCLRNVIDILTQDERWRGVIAYDEFTGRYMCRNRPPWGGAADSEWSDRCDVELTYWLACEYGMEPKRQTILDAVLRTAERNGYHELREDLTALKWDGVPRLRYWLRAYLGAEAQPGSDLERYLMLAGTKWMVSAVARVLRPGCKADLVLILEGRQGTLKSTALSVLAGKWFSDAPFRLGDREGWMAIRGKFIVELGELSEFNRAENTAAKVFFSQSMDRYRLPWGKRAVDIARACVFAGTTNHEVYLKDDTGNRRYAPVRCGDIAIKELRADRAQLWAEAVELYRQGEPWWVLQEEQALFLEEQEKRYIGDSWEITIARYLDENPVIMEMGMDQILAKCLSLDASKCTRAEQIRVGAIMQRLRWLRVRSSVAVGGSRAWLYRRPEEVPERPKVVPLMLKK